jgi:uncharacterized protein HemY
MPFGDNPAVAAIIILVILTALKETLTGFFNAAGESAWTWLQDRLRRREE